MTNNTKNTVLESELSIELDNGLGNIQHANFNRFRYLGAPKISDITAGKAVFAYRDEMITQWFQAFKESDFRGATKIHRHYSLVNFVAYIDSLELPLDSRSAVEAWEKRQLTNLRLGKFKANTGIKELSNIKNLYKLFGYPVEDWFSSYSIMQREPEIAYGYSDTELAQILRLLHSIFKQTSKQIMNDPKSHINANRSKSTGLIKYNGVARKTAGIISKCFCSAAFLLAYYTWGNLSSVLRLQKLEKKTTENGDWFSQSVEKPRANKMITLSIGDNSSVHAPKHALSFITRLNHLSALVDEKSENLLHQAYDGKVMPLNVSVLSSFNKWAVKLFELKADDKTELSINVSRLRKTGSQRHLALTNNPIETSMLLGNTPAVLRQHYSQGNKLDNNRQLLATSLALQESVKSKSIQKGKENAAKILKLEVLPYETFLNKYKRLGKASASRTAIGTGCKNPYTEKQSQYTKKVEHHVEGIKETSLACADILQCFNCKNQVIIEEPDDIWCLVSFRESLYDSKIDHLSQSHFYNNYQNLIARIDKVIMSINPVIKNKALNKLNQEGRHPLWPNEFNFS